MILTIDLGSSATKAGVWAEDGLVGVGHARLATHHPSSGRVEQDASTWWLSVIAACTSALAAASEAAGGGRTADVDVVVFSAARQSFVPVTDDGAPLRPALLWSDRRATDEAATLASRTEAAHDASTRIGMVLDGSAVAAKIAWLALHEPERLRASAWLLAPRDLIVWELTGVVVTDTTLASATGLYDADGHAVPELVGPAAGKLPEVVAPDTVVGKVRAAPATALGIRTGTPVVVGAGDRACEVLGTGANERRPMVAWGTTANVSMPVPDHFGAVPEGLIATRGAAGGRVLEGGVSAAGSLLEWVAGLTGTAVDELVHQAAKSPVGARGVTALPWMGGARAPWWRDDARGGFVGLGFEHGAGDLARAVFEAVAFDLMRCLERMTGAAPEHAPENAPGTDLEGVAIGGSTATTATWLEVLTGVTALAAQQRRSGEAAMAGAALVASAALGAGFDLDRLDPVCSETTPDPDAVRSYAARRAHADAVAAAAVGLP